MAKIFVSLPMAGREVEDIRIDMQAIGQVVERELEGILKPGETVEIIDTVWTDEPSPDIIANPGGCGAWYLGKSISALAEADFAVFDSNWRFARGCIIEHMVCALYDIPYADIVMPYLDDDTNDVNDYTVDRNEAARINNILSEEYEEDALGFEHDDISDLEGEAEEIEEVEDDEDDPDALEPGEYDADA